VPTSLQLQGMWEAMGTAVPCRSMWMSATLDPAELSTVDFRRALSVVELDDEDRSGPLRIRIRAPRTMWRLDLGDVDARQYPKALAARVVSEHRSGARTLVVLNTVKRATEVFDELDKNGPRAELVLLHSRFRPRDRQEQSRRALAPPRSAGSIVVTTQVLEAGVDITSETLITEVAP
jgi:CRISPR-associated endonuclease/helicase Cas3